MTATPIPPAFEPAQPKKSRTWLIILIVVLVLCCLCAVAVGLLWNFGDVLVNGVTSLFGGY